MQIQTRIFLLFLSVILSLQLTGQRSIFINYSLEEGLAQSTVLSIYQDDNSNIWFGTQSGVCKFNGHNFTNYDTRHGIGGNHITTIIQDSKRRYWFGHRYYGLSTLKGKEIQHLDITDKRVNAIAEDKTGNIWVATNGKGLFILPADSNASTENFIPLGNSIKLNSMIIYDLKIMHDNEIWVGTKNGLNILTYDDKLNIINNESYSNENGSFPVKEILSITSSGNSLVWFLGYEGIVKVKLNNNLRFLNSTFYEFKKEILTTSLNNIICDGSQNVWGVCENAFYKLQGDSIHYIKAYDLETAIPNYIHSDNEGNLWVATTNSGAYKYSGDKFSILDDKSGLLDNIIYNLEEDNNGNLWIASSKGINIVSEDGISYISEKEGYFKNPVDIIFKDSRGNIWLGNFNEDPLLRYNPKTKEYRQFKTEDVLQNNSIMTISEDKNGNIWFATLGIGATKYTYPENGKPENFKHYTKEDGLGSDIIWTIHSDKEKNLWFGSDDAGVTRYDGRNFITYNDKDGLSHLCVGAMTHDSQNNLWIATIGGGIFKFDGIRFTNYSDKNGLSSVNPFSIICDDNDIIWIGTNSGIDRFDPVKEKFKHYGKAEGFIGIENNQNSILKDANGILWFGTMNGVVRFDPEKDYPNLIPPKTIIERVQLFFSDFDFEKYADSINVKTALPIGLNLPYSKNHFTFDFVGISLTSPDKIQYQFMLENFDLTWNPVGQTTTATYTNIPPGDYIFKVKSCNGDGYWNTEPISFSFTINPPFWGTWWFRALAFIFIFGLIYLLFKLRLRSINAQRLKLQFMVDEKTVELMEEAYERKKAQEKAEESDKLKSAFLANMSHEIRTPAGSIIGFADLLKDKNLPEEERMQFLNYIINGGKSLLNLIDDIIDISKIEAGQLRINYEQVRVNSLLSELFTTFYEKMGKMDIPGVKLKLSKGYEDDDFTISTDPYRLRQILINLIGNSTKFTTNGFIEFGYNVRSDDQLEFFVKDTGTGIPKEHVKFVFDRFRQVDDTLYLNRKGTGLGLAICRKLSGLLGGEMWVKSEIDKGSTFYFTIPYTRLTTQSIPTPDIEINEDDITWEGKSILIVEDEEANFVLLNNIIKKHKAKTRWVKDGISAVEVCKSESTLYDIVLMDLKIPGISGYDAITEIRAFDKDLIIVAQTAFAMAGEREKCMDAGFDDYITKPIDRIQMVKMINHYLKG